jgi:hypothetical protein
MKKAIVVAVTAALVAGAFVGPADAGKKKKPKKVTREVAFDYVCPCVGAFQLGSATGTNVGGGPMPVGLESYLTAVAVDTAGQPVPVSIQQDLDGDGGNNPVGEFCGETTEPMQINPGLEIRVFVGLPSPDCPGPAAGGTINFTLSNLP